MNKTLVKVGSLLIAGAFGLTVHAEKAGATSIVIHAGGCKSSSNSGDIVSTTLGVKNQSTTTSRTVICSLPRVVPAPDGAATWNFFVDGTNPSGKATDCTLMAFDFEGTQVGGSQSFHATEAKYDRLLFLSTGLVNSLDYTMLSCKLPPGGVLRGFASVDAD
jgi:hypothetical protein